MQRLAICAGVSMLALVALAAVGRAQQDDRDLQPLLDRLERIERDVNMLQRQVYRGGGAPVTGGGNVQPGGNALNLEIRVGRIEDQMRGLTGQIEETNHKIDQLARRLEQLQSDLEFRLSQLEQGGGQPGAAPPPQRGAAPQPQQAPQTPPSSRGTAPQPRSSAGDAGSVPSNKEPGVLGTFRPAPGQDQGSAQAPVLVPPPTPAPGSETASLPPGSPLDQYNYAFGLLRQARYEDAEQAFRTFIQHNPNDPLAASAQYWLGESYYARKDYSQAASAFAECYEKYPKGTKAPDSLLKLGMSLANLGQKDNACRAFLRLEHDFPQAQSYIKERETAEKRRVGCG
ncbi:MAG TPA: tol-pal system protein YbgF [Stellaceae bacterium]|nr:tol-pal system protein YbgF [Stellaceae bacterium]